MAKEEELAVEAVLETAVSRFRCVRFVRFVRFFRSFRFFRFFRFFVVFALFIDLLTDKVQPLSRWAAVTTTFKKQRCSCTGSRAGESFFYVFVVFSPIYRPSD
jgi:hypothetical protein